jgi:hypothetical protein
MAVKRWIQLQGLHHWIELRSVHRTEWMYRVGWYAILGMFVREYWEWCQEIPPSGKAVLALAMAAAVMPLRGEFKRGAAWHGIEKSVWILLLFAFFFLENIAIDKEHQAASEAQQLALKTIGSGFNDVLTTQQASFASLVGQSQANFRLLIQDEQKNFQRMVNNSLRAQLHESQEFTAVLSSEKELFESEQELFQSLNGQLIPADDPMPETKCGLPSKDQYLVSVNGSGQMFRKFPHIAVVHNRYKAVWLEKKQDGRIALSIDIRDSNRRIGIRIDRNGFFVHSGANLFPRRPDKSSIVIQNEFGDDVLSVKYANPQAFVVTGSLEGLGDHRFGCIDGDIIGVYENNGP